MSPHRNRVDVKEKPAPHGPQSLPGVGNAVDSNLPGPGEAAEATLCAPLMRRQGTQTPIHDALGDDSHLWFFSTQSWLH